MKLTKLTAVCGLRICRAPLYRWERTHAGRSQRISQNAVRCAELAVSARSEQLKAALLQLSKNWEHLAIDLENRVAMLDEVEVVSSEICLSVDE